VLPTAYRPPTVQPLNRRAWAYQERVLSTRTLSFGQGVVSWKCQTKPSHPLVTGFDTPSQQNYIDKYDFNDNLPSLVRWRAYHHKESYPQANIWKTILDNYTTREISLHEDRLAALGGIAAQLNDYRPDSYLAGF
jgi:hypothetical protein